MCYTYGRIVTHLRVPHVSRFSRRGSTTPLAISSRRPISTGVGPPELRPPHPSQRSCEGSGTTTSAVPKPDNSASCLPLFRISPSLGVSLVHAIGEEPAKIDSKAPNRPQASLAHRVKPLFSPPKIAQPLSFLVPARIARAYFISKKYFVRQMFASSGCPTRQFRS